MQYAEHLPRLAAPKSIVGPAVALVIGAAAATGAYALLDDDSVVQPTATKVIVAEPPAQAGEGVGAKSGSKASQHGTYSRGSSGSQYGTSQYRFAQP